MKQSPSGGLYLSSSCDDLDIFYQPVTLDFVGNKTVSLNLQHLFTQQGALCNLDLLVVAAAPTIQVYLNSKAFTEIGVTFDLDQQSVSFNGGFVPVEATPSNDSSILLISLVICGVVLVLGGATIVVMRR